MQRSVRGGVSSLTAQVTRFVLQTLTTVVLARLLSPDDFGLVAMVAVVVGFAQIFKDAGLSTVTVQRDSITRQQVSALFWANLGLSVALMLSLSILAPVVARFFRSPELVPITIAISTTFLINGLALQHDALLRRRLKFGAIATIQIVSQAASLVVAVLVASSLSSDRYWALIAGTLTSAVLSTVLTYYFCPWIPGKPQRGNGLRSMLLFGGHLMGFEFVNYFARNLDNLLIGRVLGAGPLGLYSKAYQLFMLPIVQIRTPLSQVALPILSRLRNDPERYRRFYARLVEITAVLTVPITVYCVIEAPFLIRVLLGEQWLGAVRTFQILALAGIIQPTSSTVGLVMISQGRADRQLKMGVVNTLVMVIAYAIGLSYGIEGVAVGFTVGSYVVMAPSLHYGFSETPVHGVDVVNALWPCVVSGLLAGSVGILSRYVVGGDSVWAHLALAVTFTVSYVALTLARSSVRQSIRMVRAAWLGRAAPDLLL